MLSSPVISLAVAIVTAQPAEPATTGPVVAQAVPAEHIPPTTRRLVVPIAKKSKLEADAFMGEGIVDLRIKRPDARTLPALQAQVGEIVERLEVFDDDADLLTVRLYTAVPYPQVELTRDDKRGHALVDVTVHPHALTPREPIVPPVFALDLRDVRLPLPNRTYRASSRMGLDVLELMDDRLYAEASIEARRAIERDEPAEFLSEVLTEMHAREGATALASIDTLGVPDSASGKVMWAAMALEAGKGEPASDVLRGLTSAETRRLAPYIKLYNTQIARLAGTESISAKQMTKLVRQGKKLPDGYAAKACLLLAGALIERENLAGARVVLGAVDTPMTGLWKAEAAYVLGEDKAAEKGFRAAMSDPTTGPMARLRLIDLGKLGDRTAEERVLGELNLRAKAGTVAMLARARLLERGLLTKSFESTLLSLGHLASVEDPAVALDAELRIGRLKAKSGNPADAVRALLRAETHAADRISRLRARARGQDAFVAAVEQLIRWKRADALLDFVREFDEFMQVHPERAELMTLTAAAARQIGDTDLAVKYLIDVASMESGKVRHRVLAELVETYLQAGDIARARTILEYAAESGATKSSPALSRASAETLRINQQPERAISAFMRSASIATTATARVENLALAAEVAFDHHLYPAAGRALTRIIRKERPSAQVANQARIDLAMVHLLEGRAPQAIGLLEHVRTTSVAEATAADVVAVATYFEGEARWRNGDFSGARAVWASRAAADTEWDALSRAAVDSSEIAARIGSPTKEQN